MKHTNIIYEDKIFYLYWHEDFYDIYYTKAEAEAQAEYLETIDKESEGY